MENELRNIPINPTWEQQVEMCIILIEYGDKTGRDTAIGELRRIGRYMDKVQNKQR